MNFLSTFLTLALLAVGSDAKKGKKKEGPKSKSMGPAKKKGPGQNNRARPKTSFPASCTHAAKQLQSTVTPRLSRSWIVMGIYRQVSTHTYVLAATAAPLAVHHRHFTDFHSSLAAGFHAHSAARAPTPGFP